MTNRYIGAQPSRRIDDSDHRSILALLPEYVAIRVLDQELPPQWQPLEQHLAGCATCRAEANVLIKLMDESYSGALPTVPTPPAPDLAFLHQQQQPQRGTPLSNGKHTPVRRLKPQPIVIQFSAALLPRMRVHMAARTGNIRLRYAYEIPPASAADPSITVEVLVHDDQPAIGLVRVCVELPDRNPFDQEGTHVSLQIDDLGLSAVTDQNGVAMFPDVPLDQMERWKITIAPHDTSSIGP